MNTHDLHHQSNRELLSEDLLWGVPQRSDAEFLVSLRSRLSRQSTGIWLTSRKVSMAFGLAVVLLVGIWIPAQMTGVQLADQSTSIDESVDEFAYDEADPTDLADYLGVDADFTAEDDEDDVLIASVSTS